MNYKSPDLSLEEHVSVLYERLHHLPLVADVVEGRHGVEVGIPHEGRPEDDGEVLRVHQVEFLVLCNPETDGNKSDF